MPVTVFRVENILPITLAMIDLAAAVVYAVKGDMVRAWYWISAGSITTSTLWIK